jgi:periodic tryptophan protein 2
LIYSLDHGVVFDPFDLEVDVTPVSTRQAVKDDQFLTAIMMSFRLNEQTLVQEVIEAVPISYVDFVARSLPDVYVDKLLGFIAGALETSGHLEFYLAWAQRLLVTQGPRLKGRSLAVTPTLRALQKGLVRLAEQLGKMCDGNKHSLAYILALGETSMREAVKQEDTSDDRQLEGALMNKETGETGESSNSSSSEKGSSDDDDMEFS